MTEDMRHYGPDAVRLCEYDQDGRLIYSCIVLPDTAIPEIPEASSMRVYGWMVEAPEQRPEHGPGCHCVTCYRILAHDRFLDDKRLSRRLMKYMSEEIERWKDTHRAWHGAWAAEVRKRWKMRKEIWRLRRALAVEQAINDIRALEGK